MKRIITRQALEKLLQKLHPDDLDTLIPFPPKAVLHPVKLSQVSCIPCSLFIGARYLKFSRCLSQTPWFMEEDRKGDTSVEELMCSKIQEKFQCQSYRFMSSGRDDFDVRMLGDGRPFGKFDLHCRVFRNQFIISAVELIGAKVAMVSAVDMMTLQDSINSSSKDIEIRDLQDEVDDEMVRQRRRRSAPETSNSVEVLFAIIKGKSGFMDKTEIIQTLTENLDTLESALRLDQVLIARRLCRPETCAFGDCKERTELGDAKEAPFVSVVGNEGQSHIFPRHRQVSHCTCNPGYGGKATS